MPPLSSPSCSCNSVRVLKPLSNIRSATPLTGLAERFDLVGEPPREEDDYDAADGCSIVYCKATANSVVYEVEGKAEKLIGGSARPRGSRRGDERRALGVFSASEAMGS